MISVSVRLALSWMFACAVSAQSPTETEWPRFRGPEGNSIVLDPSFHAPTVAQGRKLWTASVGKGYSGLSIAAGKAVTLGNKDGRDQVVCLDAASGRELWRHDYPAEPGSYPGPRASPWIEGNRVYAMSYWGHVYCLDVASGRPLWSRNVAQEVGADHGRWGFAGSPVVDGNALIINVGKAGCALDEATGRLLWKTGGGTSGYSTPVPLRHRGRPHWAIFGAKAFYLVEAAGGRIAFQHPWETSWDVNAADPLPVGDRVFITSGYGKGCALLDLAGSEPKEVWRNKAIASHFSSVVLHKDHIYGCDGNTGKGHLVCLRAADGQELWRETLGFGSVILINDTLVHFNEKGTITIAPAQTEGFRSIARVENVVTGGKVWTAPVYAYGRLFMRNDQGDIAAIAASR